MSHPDAARRLVGLREHAQYATHCDQLQHMEVGLLMLDGRHGESRWQRRVRGEQVLNVCAADAESRCGEDGQRAQSRAEEARWTQSQSRTAK